MSGDGAASCLILNCWTLSCNSSVRASRSAAGSGTYVTPVGVSRTALDIDYTLFAISLLGMDGSSETGAISSTRSSISSLAFPACSKPSSGSRLP